jgi:hypothetical protein
MAEKQADQLLEVKPTIRIATYPFAVSSSSEFVFLLPLYVEAR